MTLGGSIGFALGTYNKFDDKLQRHAAAVRALEAQTGKPVPFAVAHPYLGNVLPGVTGAAAGAALAGPGLGSRAVGATAGMLAAGLTAGPFVSNYLQAQREKYLSQLEKPASTVLADPRLLHPGLVERPQNIEESARRREENLNFTGTGATLGGLAGLAAAHVLLKKNPKFMQELAEDIGAHALPGRAYAAGGLGGVLAGAVTGAAAAPAARGLARIKKHDDAVHKFERESGERIPFLARHPYLMSAGPAVAAAAYGAIRPHQAWKELGPAGRAITAGLNAATAGLTLGVLGNAISHNERSHYFKGRVPTLSMDRYGLNSMEEQHTADELDKQWKVSQGEMDPSELV